MFFKLPILKNGLFDSFLPLLSQNNKRLRIVYYATSEESKQFSPRVIFSAGTKQEQQNYSKWNRLSFCATYDTFLSISVEMAAFVCVRN